MAVVYVHMKPETRDIFYVGIGSSVQRAYRNEGRNSHWTRVFKKYGKVVDIISDSLSLESAKQMEKFLIASIGIDNLCNQTLGGEGAFGLKHSEETKRKISIANTGKVVSEQTRAKISAKSKGHPNYNLSHTEEAKVKMSAAFKGKKRSEYFCNQVKKSKQGYRPHPSAWEGATKLRKEKAALIIEINSGFIGKIWEIEKEFNIDRRAVYYNCKKDKAILTREWKGLNFKKHIQ
jgi:hypothetical protein